MPSLDDSIFQSPPLPSPDEASTGSGRRKALWVIGLAILVIIAFFLIRSSLSSDPADKATAAVTARNGGAEASIPVDPALLENNIWCADHAKDTETFTRWYCTEFRVRDQRIEERLKELDAREAPSTTALWVVIVILGVLLVFTWATMAKKKNSDS